MANRQIEIPVHNNSVVTSRSLNSLHVSNSHIILPEEQEQLEELKKKLIELKIRFDTNPHFYLREDYKEFIDLISSALIHLYQLPENIIVSDWDEIPEDSKVPSEKLVSSALSQKANIADVPTKVSQLTNDSGYLNTEVDPTVPLWAKTETKPSYTSEEVGALASNTDIKDINDSTGLRSQWSNKLDTILDLSDIRSGAASGATALQPNDIAEWAKSPTKPEYTAQEVGAIPNNTDIKDLNDSTGLMTEWSGKQDKLIAGENIQISGNTISATDTTYTASDFDIKDLSDSTDLRGEWSGKQDEIIDLNEIRRGASLGITAIQVETDPTVSEWAKQENKPTYTAEEVGALPDDTFIPTNVSDLNNDVGYITSKDIPVIDKTSDSSGSFAIDPNKMYMFGTRTNLTITLNAETSGIVNEYMLQFTSDPSTATTLNVPSSVIWLKDPDILKNKKYLVSIENSLGIIGEWNNE